MSITQITGVNDAGAITGFYVDASTGLDRGFIATPVSTTPEPGTFVLTGSFVLLAPLRFSRTCR